MTDYDSDILFPAMSKDILIGFSREEVKTSIVETKAAMRYFVDHEFASHFECVFCGAHSYSDNEDVIHTEDCWGIKFVSKLENYNK
jgi:hypothetical protein